MIQISSERLLVIIWKDGRHPVGPPLIPIMCQIYPVHIFPPCFSKIHSNIIFPSTPRSYTWSLPLRFSNKNFAPVSLCLDHSKFERPCDIFITMNNESRRAWSERGARNSLDPENEGSMASRNVGIPLHHFTVSQPRGPRLYIYCILKQSLHIKVLIIFCQ
jgi:hypothetical protein